MSPSRIDELRRRVQNDPASIAFAQLAEEYRRSGQTDEAVRICREGLVRHPGYLSARVTLGRALLDLGHLADARAEFEFVVAEAPENLAAVRGLAEIFHRDGQTVEALSYYQRALALARHDPEIEEIVQQLSRQIGVAQAGPPGGLSFEEAHQELLSAAERVPLAAHQPPATGGRDLAEGSTAPFDFDRLVAALGSPAAPPQLEAAVAGHAAPVLELPDLGSTGPNPFAALEAELRAHETGTPAAAAVSPIIEAAAGTVPGAAPAEPQPPATEGRDLQDSLADVSAVLEASLSPEPAPVPAEHPFEIPAALDAATAPESAVDDMLAEMAGNVSDMPPVGPSGPPAPAAKAEDVLGDLEDWLNTLHDKSTE